MYMHSLCKPRGRVWDTSVPGTLLSLSPRWGNFLPPTILHVVGHNFQHRFMNWSPNLDLPKHCSPTGLHMPPPWSCIPSLSVALVYSLNTREREAQEAKTSSFSASIYILFHVAHQERQELIENRTQNLTCMWQGMDRDQKCLKDFCCYSQENTGTERFCGGDERDKIHTHMKVFLT